MKARLYVSAKVKVGDELADLTERMTEAVGHEPDGSGVGFGNRDLEFTIDSAEEATAAENRFIQWASSEGRAAQAQVETVPTADDISDAIAKVLTECGKGLEFDELLHQRLFEAVMAVVKEKLEE